MDLAPAACLALAVLAGCSLAPGDELPADDAPPPGEEASPWTDAAGAAHPPELAALCVDLWEEMLRADPIAASRHGDPRYLAALPDHSVGARAARRGRLVALRERAAALAPDGLAEADAVTLEMARAELERALALHDLDLGRWLVSPSRGVHVVLFNLAPDQPTDTAAERQALLARWEAMPDLVDQTGARLRAGLAEGLVSTRTALEKSIGQLDDILARPVADWPLGRPAVDHLAADERRRFLDAVHAHLEDGLRPALGRFRATLATELLPAARPDATPGLSSLPGGTSAYRTLIACHTGLDLTAERIHAIGRREVARIRGEIAALGRRHFGTDDVGAIQRRLREDPALHFATRDEVEALAIDSLARARAAMSRWFGVLPDADCVVVRIAEHEERDTTIAYYRRPAADGSRPGRYYINTHAPTTRPRWDARVLAYHESIPGHHLQIAIAQELAGVPRFQREAGSTAFVEGWALYTERLADEMGLYDDDLDRLGMLGFDAWRACRLVVDTGLHALGMSRDEAIAYLLENTLLTRDNVVNEVDRYIANPGQALAYKLGQLEILDLRRRAEESLGQDFDIRAFHDVVLSRGAVTLPVLRRRVEMWIDAG